MEWNLGMNRECVYCGKDFWCTDGDITCSSMCSNKMDEDFYSDQIEDVAIDLENLLFEFKEGDISEKKFKKDWNRVLIHAEEKMDLYPADLKALQEKLMKEYEASI